MESRSMDGFQLFSHTKKNKKRALPSFPCPVRVRDWSELPRDISDLIGDKIDFLPHLKKFGAACKEWRNIAYERVKIVKSEPPIILMLPYNPETQIATILEMKNSGRYKLKMPELQGQWICSVSNGWLAMIDYNSLDLVLFNPLTRTRIKLPPQDPSLITHFHEDREGFDCDVSELNGLYLLIKRVVLSGDPSSTDCFIAIIYSDFGMLAVCRLGDDSWTLEVPCLKWQGFEDIIFHRGNIFAAREDHFVSVYEYSKEGHLSCSKIIQPPSFQDSQLSPLQMSPIEHKLVESRGDLFYIISYAKRGIEFLEDADYSPKKKWLFGIDVFKFEPNKEGEPWSRVHSLGDRSLFLGRNDCICVSIKDFPWCKPNCIYFTDEYGFDGFHLDNGVYSMEERRVISRFDIQHSTPVWHSAAIWFRPNV